MSEASIIATSPLDVIPVGHLDVIREVGTVEGTRILMARIVTPDASVTPFCAALVSADDDAIVLLRDNTTDAGYARLVLTADIVMRALRAVVVLRDPPAETEPAVEEARH